MTATIAHSPVAWADPETADRPSPLFTMPHRARVLAVGAIHAKIASAVDRERYLISWHADERCEERGVSVWQLVAGLGEARLLRERPGSLPHPTIVVRQMLADGASVDVVWSWMAPSGRAKMVTVYFPD